MIQCFSTHYVFNINNLSSGAHGDGGDFDGKGGVHGHASAALKAIHFDQDEDWTSFKNGDQFRWLHPKPGGSDFIQSAMHEIGHVLSLGHSTDVKSAMYPILQTFTLHHEYGLSEEDITKSQALYGKFFDGKLYFLHIIVSLYRICPSKIDSSVPYEITLCIISKFIELSPSNTNSLVHSKI